MNDSDVYGKTISGMDEMRQRLHKLPQRLRTMLILVDGSRSVQQLRQAAKTVGAPEDFFHHLIGLGLVALAVAGAPQKAVAAPLDFELESMPVPLGAPQSEGFSTALKFMNDSAVNALGLRAFFFTLKLERCFTAQDLQALLPEFSKAMSKALGDDAALVLEERVRVLLR